MNNGSNKRRLVRFGHFEVDLQTGELRKSGVKVRLQEQPFRVLSVLLERPGEVITRDQLRERLWPDDTFVEFEQGLNAAVNRLRTALSDSANDPRWIETVPRRGYRFLGKIEFSETAREASATAAPTRPTSRERLAWAVAAVFLTAFVVTTFSPVTSEDTTPQDAPVRRFSFTPETPGGTGGRNRTGARIAPNGRHIVYTVVRGGVTRLEVRDIGFERPRELDGTEGALHPFWSLESRFIGFASDRKLRKISVSGGPATVLCDLPGPFFSGGAWTPDGTSIVFGGGGSHHEVGLYEVSDRGGWPTLLFQEARGASQPEFLPSDGGRFVLFSSSGSGHEFLEVVLKNLEIGESRMLVRGRRAVYSATGHILYEAGNPPDIWALPFSVPALEATGEAFPVVQNGSEPSIAADGTLLFVDDAGVFRPARLVWRDRKGKKVANVEGSEHFISTPRLSPDGQRVAFRGIRDHRSHIWVHDLGRATSTRITLAGERAHRPAWSPSGKQIIYDSDRDVWSRSSSGSGDAHRVVSSARDDITADWSGDGKHIIYHVRDPETVRDLWYVTQNQDGSWSEPTSFLQTPFNENNAKFSPDGRYVAYLSNKSGRTEVYVCSFPECQREMQVSKNGGRQPRWSGDSGELFYVEPRSSSSGALFAVEVVTEPTLSVGSPTLLFQDEWPGADYTPPNYDVSFDGQRILMGEWLDQQRADGPPTIRIVQNWYEDFRDREQD